MASVVQWVPTAAVQAEYLPAAEQVWSVWQEPVLAVVPDPELVLIRLEKTNCPT